MAVSLPTTYRATFFENKGAQSTLREVELQQPGSGYILVRALACGVCHSDDLVQQGHLGDVFPCVPGMEVSLISQPAFSSTANNICLVTKATTDHAGPVNEDCFKYAAMRRSMV